MRKLRSLLTHAWWQRVGMTVLGAELVARPTGYAYRFGDKQLNVHGPGVQPAEVARS